MIRVKYVKRYDDEWYRVWYEPDGFLPGIEKICKIQFIGKVGEMH